MKYQINAIILGVHILQSKENLKLRYAEKYIKIITYIA